MQYELTITVRLESDHDQDRVGKKFASLFNFGTIKESIVDGLQLRKDPSLVAVSVRGRTKRGKR